MLGRVVAGRYRLEARAGEGGMGVVYRARHVLIDRVVALKLIRPDLRGETHLRAWMLREARAANRVDPDALNELDRLVLREAFKQAKRLQSRLQMEYRL